MIGEVGGRDEIYACRYLEESGLLKRKYFLLQFTLTIGPSWLISRDYARGFTVRWVILVHSCLIRLNAGAIRDGSKSTDDTAQKIKIFRQAGIPVLNHIGNIGEEMRDLLKKF